jgi:hypothetical protein
LVNLVALVSIQVNLSCSALQEEFIPRDDLLYYLRAIAVHRRISPHYASAFFLNMCKTLQTMLQGHDECLHLSSPRL